MAFCNHNLQGHLTTSVGISNFKQPACFHGLLLRVGLRLEIRWQAKKHFSHNSPMMHISLLITKQLFDFTLGCLWNVQIQFRQIKMKIKKKITHLPQGSNPTRRFWSSMLYHYSKLTCLETDQFKTSSSVHELNL